MPPKSVHYVKLCDPNGILKNRPIPDPSRLVSERSDKLSKCRGGYINISKFVEYRMTLALYKLSNRNTSLVSNLNAGIFNRLLKPKNDQMVPEI
jgi:hypothetical protein